MSIVATRALPGPQPARKTIERAADPKREQGNPARGLQPPSLPTRTTIWFGASTPMAESRGGRSRPAGTSEQAALKCLWLVTRSLDPTGRGAAPRWAMRWKPALIAFAITSPVVLFLATSASRQRQLDR